MQSWVFLYVAILFEVGGTMALKQTHGLTKLLPAVVAYVLYSTSLGALSIALKQIDVGIAYAIWSGLGTTLVAIVGILYFKEPASALKIASLVLVAAGVIGLNLSSATPR